jgi:hypothetical protein
MGFNTDSFLVGMFAGAVLSLIVWSFVIKPEEPVVPKRIAVICDTIVHRRHIFYDTLQNVTYMQEGDTVSFMYKIVPVGLKRD